MSVKRNQARLVYYAANGVIAVAGAALLFYVVQNFRFSGPAALVGASVFAGGMLLLVAALVAVGCAFQVRVRELSQRLQVEVHAITPMTGFDAVLKKYNGSSSDPARANRPIYLGIWPENLTFFDSRMAELMTLSVGNVSLSTRTAYRGISRFEVVVVSMPDESKFEFAFPSVWSGFVLWRGRRFLRGFISRVDIERLG